MTAMPVMPHEEREWTVEDLDRLPDDGLQYELLDGVLLVSPAPLLGHQRVVRKLCGVLEKACTAGYEVYFAPVDWRPDDRTSLQPDLLVVPIDIAEGARNLRIPLPLAVEVLSPSTRLKDLTYKRAKYEEAGVRAYWVVDPAEPSIQAYELRDGHFVDVGSAGGHDSLHLRVPFPVAVRPSELIVP
jgi:Uma2 family endonuclease